MHNHTKHTSSSPTASAARRFIDVLRPTGRALILLAKNPVVLMWAFMLVSAIFSAPAHAATTVTSDGGTSSGIKGLLVGFILPVVTAASGIAWATGGLGHMFRPDKKELLNTLSAVGVAGVVVAGGPEVLMLVMDAIAKGNQIQGALI